MTRVTPLRKEHGGSFKNTVEGYFLMSEGIARIA
jgi:hypothetical protein